MTTEELKALPIEQVREFLARNGVAVTSGEGFPSLQLLARYGAWEHPFSASFKFGENYGETLFRDSPTAADRQALIERASRRAAECLLAVNPEAA